MRAPLPDVDWTEAIKKQSTGFDPKDLFFLKYQELKGARTAGSATQRHPTILKLGDLESHPRFVFNRRRHFVGKPWAWPGQALEKQSAEEIIADWFAEQECRVVYQSEEAVNDEARRLTHDTVRRVSDGVLIIVFVTQLIFLITHVIVLNPMAAALIGAIALSFRRMSTLMRRELHQRLQSLS